MNPEPPMTAAPERRLRNFAWMLALVVLLRMAAWEIHHAFDAHAVDEHCEICAVVERSGDTPAMANGQPAAPLSSDRLLAPPGIIAAPAFAASPLPRGPPRHKA